MHVDSRRSAGFSMIEVLVSLIITVVGILGMVALQSKAIPYTQDSAQRNTAIMLVDDLLEIIRSSPSDCSTSNGCIKAPGAAFPSAAAACIPNPVTLSQQIGCWSQRAGGALPGASALLGTSSFFICRSLTPGDETASACATSDTADTELEIQVAWTVKSAAECLNGNASTAAGVCTYRVRTRTQW